MFKRCDSSLQVTGKRSEGKEPRDFQGGEYEAAVNQEKRDDRRSLQELPGEGGASEEEVSVVALNVSLLCWIMNQNQNQTQAFLLTN